MTEREKVEFVWRERAARLSRPSAPAGAARDVIQVMVMNIGNERYGIELAAVAEVLPPVRCIPVPGAPPVLAGVINAHGEIRPVIDLRRMLGIEYVAPGEPAPIVLLRKQGRRIGLQPDRVEQVRSISSGEMRCRDDGQMDLATRYLEAITHDTLMLLSAEALFAELWMEVKAI